MTLPAFLLFNGVLLCAAVCDLRSYRIPNAVSALLAAAGLVAHPPATLGEALLRLGSVAVVTVIGGVLWTRRAIGGGDLKLLMACAVWIPLSTLAGFGMWLGWLGALQGLATLALTRWTPLSAAPAGAGRAGSYVPYAVSIAGAGLLWSVPALSL